MTYASAGSAGLLLGPLLLAQIFIHEGCNIIGSYSGAVGYMEKFGVPGILLPPVIALELGGGLLIALAAITRVVSLAFAAFCVLTAIKCHRQFIDRNQLLHFKNDLAIA
jgi:putative oxidoreductase